MTRLLVRLVGLILLCCVGVGLLALVVGHVLPVEDEILFTASFEGRDFEIYRMMLGRGLSAALTHNADYDAQPMWSPDGRQIAFINQHDDQWRIFLMDAQGGHPRRLTDDYEDESRPIWSPDGQYIAYEKLIYSFSSALFVINLQTGSTTLLTDGDSGSNAAAWLPDSRSLSFAADPNKIGTENIYTVDINNRAMHPLIKSESSTSLPAWSPDGRYLSYIGGSPNRKYLYLWDATTAESILLYTAPTFIISTPNWSPDSQSLMFTLVSGPNNIYTSIVKLDVTTCLRESAACMATALTHKNGTYFNPSWKASQP